MNRIQSYLDSVEAALKAVKAGGKPVFNDVRVQLDPFDLEDVLKQSFKAPAARVLLARWKFHRNPDRALDIICDMAIAVVTKRQGNQAADTLALDLSVVVHELVDGNRWGQTSITAPADLTARVAVQPSIENKGLSIVLLGFQQKLLRVTGGEPRVHGLVLEDGATAPDLTKLQINGEDVELGP